MKKIISFVLFSFLFTLTAYTQDEEKRALILRTGDFKWLEPANPRDKEEFIEIIKAFSGNAATESGRFELLDDEIISSESRYFQREEFMELDEIKRKEMLGKLMNDYTLFGNITKCKFTKKTTGAMGYTCVLTVKLSVTNALSGKDEFVASRTFVSNFKNMIVRNTMGAALDDALQSMSEKMIGFFTNNFAVYGTVNRIQGNDVVISCGHAQGLKKGDEFQITFLTFVADGSSVEEPVGVVKIKDFLADGTSICDIKSGKDGINNRFLASNTSQWLRCKLILK